MEDFAYLSYDAKTNKASLTNNFIGQVADATTTLRDARIGYLAATDEAIAAQKSYDDAKAEATANGLIGKNAEERAANLEITLRPLHDLLIEKKKAQRAAEFYVQICGDSMRELQMVLEAVKVGVVRPSFTSTVTDCEVNIYGTVANPSPPNVR